MRTERFARRAILFATIFQIINGYPDADHRRDGPIPYPVRVNADHAPRLYNAMDVRRPLFTDSVLLPENNRHQVNFDFNKPQNERPPSANAEQHRFEIVNRDAPTEPDRQSPQDRILSALQASNISPIPLAPNKLNSPESRVDSNAPFFALLAHPNRQPDNLRDYAFLEDSDDTHHIPISITAPISTVLTQIRPPTTTSTSPRKAKPSLPTTTTPKQPSSSDKPPSPTIKPSTATAAGNKSKVFRVEAATKTHNNNNKQTTNDAVMSELRMALNNKHHEIKRSPQQELLYTPSFRRRNTNSNNAGFNFNNAETFNPNRVPTSSANPNSYGFINNGGYGIPTDTQSSNGYPSSSPRPTTSYGSQNDGTSFNHKPNTNNNDVYGNNNNNYPNNFYPNNQYVPYGGQGIPSYPQIPIPNPITAPNYNLLPIYAPPMPINFRAQQPIAFNTYPGVNVPSIAFPIQLAGIHSLPSAALLPGYLPGPPASVINPASSPATGFVSTPPYVASNLNLVNPYIGFYSQPLVNSVPTTIHNPIVLAHTPYMQTTPIQNPSPAPVYRTPSFTPPNTFMGSQRPFNNDYDIDDDDDDDDNRHHGFINNQQGPNSLPPVYIANNANNPPGGDFIQMAPFIPLTPNNVVVRQPSNRPTFDLRPSMNTAFTGNTRTPGLISDSFPEFQPSGSFSSGSNEPPSDDADFADRPKKGNKNRGSSGNRHTEETTSYRPQSTTRFGTRVTQQIPRVEPVEGRTLKSINGDNKLLLSQNFTENESITTVKGEFTTVKDELTEKYDTTTDRYDITTENYMTTEISTEKPDVNITFEPASTTTIVISNITLNEDDDSTEHINITITDPTTSTQVPIAEDRISKPFSEQLAKPASYVSTPRRSDEHLLGYSINDPYLRNFIAGVIEPNRMSTTGINPNNGRNDRDKKETRSCEDLFGRKIPNCKISRTTPTVTNSPLSKIKKTKPVGKSFEPNLFDIVEGGIFSDPKPPITIATHAYINAPPETVPLSDFEHMILAGNNRQQFLQAAFAENPQILPLRLQSLRLAPRNERPLTYDRRSVLIAQGHPSSNRRGIF